VSQKSVDHRKAPRCSLQLPVEFLLRNGGRLRVFTRNISASGLFVSVHTNLHLDDYLHFVVMFPSEITLACRLLALCEGSVVRRELTEDSEGLAIRIGRYQFLSSQGLSSGTESGMAGERLGLGVNSSQE
jgi:hypothetical protein